MKPININNIPDIIGNKDGEWWLTFDGGDDEDRLFVEPYIQWYEPNENKYKRIEKMIDKFEIKRKHFTVYCGYDVSGYNYWITDMNEGNYFAITVCLHNRTLPRHSILPLARAVQRAWDKFKKFESFI